MLSSWPHPAPNADTPVSIAFSLSLRCALIVLRQCRTISVKHWSVKFLQPPRSSNTISPGSSSIMSQPRTRQASIFICTCDTRIPRLDSHFSDERPWPHLSIAGHLKLLSSLIQLGLNTWLETAASKVARLRTSSHEDRKSVCRSSLSREKNDGIIHRKGVFGGYAVVHASLVSEWLLCDAMRCDAMSCDAGMGIVWYR